MFACGPPCCTDTRHSTAVIVEPSSSSDVAPKIADVDEADVPPSKVVQEEAQLDSVPALVSEFLEFKATLDKSGGEKLGLDISAYDGKTLLVGKVKPGPVERWNAQHAGQWDMCILRGDRFIVINDVRDDSDQLLGAARSDVLNVTMRRCIEFVVTLEYNGSDNFGTAFEDMPDGRVIISRLDEGIADDTNQLNPADMEIRPGDQVLQLNGVDCSNAAAVRTAMAVRTSAQAAGTLSFRLRRSKPNS